MINKLVISSILVFLLAISFVYAQVIGTWRGYVYMSGSLAADGTYVTAHINNASSAAATTRIGGEEYDANAPSGYYSLDVECTGSYVDFKVCGIRVPIASQACTSGPHYNGTEPNFNLTVTKLSDGVSCSYSCACSGQYCCDGATEYTDGSGTGTCQSSACSAAPTTTVAAAGGGGGGVAAATTTTTVAPVTTIVPAAVTTTIPPVVTTTIPVTTTTVKVKPLAIPKLPTVWVIGAVIGILVIVILIVFAFVRTQSVVVPA